ncbi:hypothetical protein HK104_005714 [Borealophlyctis nickersoniae]|nr:hypothetical protein HK104_005714 [Borealophlyctis nickersoniae]
MSIWEILCLIGNKKELVPADFRLRLVLADGKEENGDEERSLVSYGIVDRVVLEKKAGGRRTSAVMHAPKAHPQTVRMLSTEFPKTLTDAADLAARLAAGQSGTKPADAGTVRNKPTKTMKSLSMLLFNKKSGTDIGSELSESSQSLASSQGDIKDAAAGIPLNSIDEERRRSEMLLASSQMELNGGGSISSMQSTGERDQEIDKDREDSDIDTLASYDGAKEDERGHFLSPDVSSSSELPPLPNLIIDMPKGDQRRPSNDSRSGPRSAADTNSIISFNQGSEVGSMISITNQNQVSSDASLNTIPARIGKDHLLDTFASSVSLPALNDPTGSNASLQREAGSSSPAQSVAGGGGEDDGLFTPSGSGLSRSNSTASRTDGFKGMSLDRKKIRKRTISSPSTGSSEESPKSSAATLRRGTFRQANRQRSTNDVLLTLDPQAIISPELDTPPAVPGTPISDGATTPTSADDKRTVMRVYLPSLQTTMIKVPPELNMESILMHICQKRGIDFEKHTLEFPGRPTAVEMDRSLQYYLQEFNVTEVYVVHKEKSYSTMVISEGDRDVCILQKVGGKFQVMAATADKLIERLTDQEEEADSSFVDTLLLSYRSFMTPLAFFDQLVARFNCELPPNPSPEDVEYFERMKVPTQRRVLAIFKWWVQYHYHDFGVDSNLKADFEDFADQIEDYRDADFKNDAKELRAIIAKQSRVYEEMFNHYKAVERRGKTMESMFQGLSAEDVGQQLAIHNFKLFRNIHPIELLNKIWQKDDEGSPSLNHFIQRFDLESYWVATEICSVKDLKKRILVLKKFIQTAKICLEVNNFFTLFALIAGLNLSPVQRLKKTWEGLGEKSKKTWTEIEKIGDPSKNMKNYRDCLAACSPPIVPFLPIYLKDLTFMNDGNQSTVRGMINFDKLRMMGNRVKDISSLANIEYKFEPNPPIQNYLSKPPVERSLAALKEMSLLCEKKAEG